MEKKIWPCNNCHNIKNTLTKINYGNNLQYFKVDFSFKELSAGNIYLLHYHNYNFEYPRCNKHTSSYYNNMAYIIQKNCYNWLNKIYTNDGKKGIWFRLAERSYNKTYNTKFI